MSVKRSPHTSWQLAHLAGCADPDTHDGIGFDSFEAPEGFEPSAGARFLRRVEDDVYELMQDDSYDEDDSPHEIADGAVPIYTHELWKTFVDLAAYQEDPSELGAEPDDMTKCAGVCLYMIADRLARAIAEEQSDEDEDEDGQ